MSKTTRFYGTSVFGQLISLIDTKIISESVKNHQSDHYIKKFKTKDRDHCKIQQCSHLSLIPKKTGNF